MSFSEQYPDLALTTRGFVRITSSLWTPSETHATEQKSLREKDLTQPRQVAPKVQMERPRPGSWGAPQSKEAQEGDGGGLCRSATEYL